MKGKMPYVYTHKTRYRPTVENSAGASEVILVWYGQPSEVQFTRGGEVGETKILDPRSVYFIDSRGIWGKKWYGQYRSDRTVCDAPDSVNGKMLTMSYGLRERHKREKSTLDL